jgi:hypothetical protein
MLRFGTELMGYLVNVSYSYCLGEFSLGTEIVNSCSYIIDIIFAIRESHIVDQ